MSFGQGGKVSPPFPLLQLPQRQVETISASKRPPPSPLRYAEDIAKSYMTTSDIVPPYLYKRNAELTQSSLYIHHNSEQRSVSSLALVSRARRRPVIESSNRFCQPVWPLLYIGWPTPWNRFQIWSPSSLNVYNFGLSVNFINVKTTAFSSAAQFLSTLRKCLLLCTVVNLTLLYLLLKDVSFCSTLDQSTGKE